MAAVPVSFPLGAGSVAPRLCLTRTRRAAPSRNEGAEARARGRAECATGLAYSPASRAAQLRAGGGGERIRGDEAASGAPDHSRGPLASPPAPEEARRFSEPTMVKDADRIPSRRDLSALGREDSAGGTHGRPCAPLFDSLARGGAGYSRHSQRRARNLSPLVPPCGGLQPALRICRARLLPQLRHLPAAERPSLPALRRSHEVGATRTGRHARSRLGLELGAGTHSPAGGRARAAGP